MVTTTACAGVSGGVMFVPERIERKTNKTSYKDLARNTAEDAADAAAQPPRSFGRRKVKDDALSAAA